MRRRDAHLGHEAHAGEPYRHRDAGLQHATVLGAGGDTHAAQQRGHDVVRMAFDGARQPQHPGLVERLAERLVGEEHAAGNRRGAAAQAAVEDDAVGAAQLEAWVRLAHGVVDRAGGAQDQVGVIVGGHTAGRGLDFVPQVERQTEAVKARTEVGARRRRSNYEGSQRVQASVG